MVYFFFVDFIFLFGYGNWRPTRLIICNFKVEGFLSDAKIFKWQPQIIIVS